MKRLIMLMMILPVLSGCGGAFQWGGKPTSELTAEEKTEAVLMSLDLAFRAAIFGVKAKSPETAAKMFKYGETVFQAMKAVSGEEVTARHLADVVEVAVAQADPEAGKQIREIVLVLTPVLRKVSYKLPSGEMGYKGDIIRRIADNGLAAIQDFKAAA